MHERECVQCGGRVPHRSFGLTPLRCRRCGGSWWRAWALVGGMLLVLPLGFSTSVIVSCGVSELAERAGASAADALLFGQTTFYLALITLPFLLWLVLARVEPFLIVRRKWLVDQSGTDLEHRIHLDLFRYRLAYLLVFIAALLDVVVAEGSWGARLLAVTVILVWGWGFGRSYARKWVGFVRRFMDSPAGLAAQVEHDPWSRENGT
jgi:hypothetical protein